MFYSGGCGLEMPILIFIKYEKILLDESKHQVARLIQPRRAEYNVMVGRYLKKIETLVYEALRRVSQVPQAVVMKGFNAFEVGELFHRKWARFHNPAAIGLDASRWDQHVSPSLLQWEHSVYLSYYKGRDRRELAKLLQQQIHNHGFIYVEGKRIKYTTEGTRCSGDMNTALGNCLCMVAILLRFIQDLQIPPSEYDICDNGDDCVVFLEKEHLASFTARVSGHFAQFGFVLKVEKPVYTLEEVEFCQCHPVYDGECWRMVRNVWASLSKDTALLNPVPHMLDYAHTIGECGLALTSGMPIMQEFYSALHRASDHGLGMSHPFRETGFSHLARGCVASYRDVSTAARVSFAKAFDISPDMQFAMEQYYSSVVVTDTEVDAWAPAYNLL